MNSQKITPFALVFILISVIFWGLAFPIIKITLDFVPPLVIGYFRYFLASLPFLIYILITYKKNQLISELSANWKVLVALGITMVTIPNITQNIGLQYTTSSLAALITTVAPVFTVIIAITVLNESKTWNKIFGLILALGASVIMVVYTGIELESASLYGNILIFITSVSYGISGIFSKTALIKSKPIFVTGFSMFIGSIILMPLSVLIGEPIDWALTLPVMGWYYLAILTFLPCMIGTFLWYVILQSYEVSKQVLYTYLIPVFAAIFAYVLIGEVLEPINILLGALIIIGITIAEGLLIKNSFTQKFKRKKNRI